MSRGLSPKLPLSYDPSDGYALNKTYEDMIKQNLKMLILTNPGERVMIPNFGVGLRNFLFEPYTIDTLASIKSRIESQVSDYMPFVELVNIQTGDPYTSSSSATILDLRVEFRIIPMDIFSYIELSVST
jgi:phage baseplate assembly protein W